MPLINTWNISNLVSHWGWQLKSAAVFHVTHTMKYCRNNFWGRLTRKMTIACNVFLVFFKDAKPLLEKGTQYLTKTFNDNCNNNPIKGMLCEFFILTLGQIIVCTYNKCIPEISHIKNYRTCVKWDINNIKKVRK